MAGTLDPDSIKDMEAVSEMLKQAGNHRLEVEVIVSAMQAIRKDANISIEQACANALSDWDI